MKGGGGGEFKLYQEHIHISLNLFYTFEPNRDDRGHKGMFQKFQRKTFLWHATQ